MLPADRRPDRFLRRSAIGGGAAPARRAVLLFLLVPILVFSALVLPERPAASRDGPPPGSRIFLWTIRSESATVHLLGSIHIMRKEMYPLDARIEKTFAEAETLVVETDIDGPEGAGFLAFVADNAFYPEGDGLERHVSRETYALVRRRLPDLPPSVIDRMKPWALALLAAVREYRALGLDPDYGLDRHFLEKARDRKRIVSLERYDHVPRLLDGLPDDVLDLFLSQTLSDLERAGEEMEAILSAWREGDADRMEAIVTRSRTRHPRLEPVYDRLFTRRNREMTAAIEDCLREGGGHFIVVGAGHLVGKDGILERLVRKGYAVDQQ
jgi:uncharacterized protein